VGFDALHLRLTQLSPHIRNLQDLAPQVFDSAAGVLAPFAIRDLELVERVTQLYFLELSTRYLEDQQAKTGTRLGNVEQWLLPELERRIGKAS
jgi:hypothetical protein